MSGYSGDFFGTNSKSDSVLAFGSASNDPSLGRKMVWIMEISWQKNTWKKSGVASTMENDTVGIMVSRKIVQACGKNIKR